MYAIRFKKPKKRTAKVEFESSMKEVKRVKIVVNI